MAGLDSFVKLDDSLDEIITVKVTFLSESDFCDVFKLELHLFDQIKLLLWVIILFLAVHASSAAFLIFNG